MKHIFHFGKSLITQTDTQTHGHTMMANTRAELAPSG